MKNLTIGDLIGFFDKDQSLINLINILYQCLNDSKKAKLSFHV